ncbi:Aste57867_9932 [Aphanomyces stellatus]|uniref:Aste57867_9932 protein n=1 Tax=Aphanomyces stellatus TaxID=120398 RepID=A0A485KPD0_9STRA|nr:hypothetical protein As57867_009893 [Aphanomyces stellatus]VFT86810.1 Aste57867_9932 [Aphanomyces stellatus]
MLLVNQTGFGRVWALDVTADDAPRFSARVSSFNPDQGGNFHWGPELTLPLSFAGDLVAAAFVDDLTIGLNSLFVVVRESPTTVSFACVYLSEHGVDLDGDTFHTHTLPLAWTARPIHVEVLDGPRFVLTCGEQSQVLALHNDELDIISLPPHAHALQSARLVFNAAVDPNDDSNNAFHLLAHSVSSNGEHHWLTLPLPSVGIMSRKKVPKLSPPSWAPPRYIPRTLNLASVSCVHIFQRDDRHPNRILAGTTAPSLVDIVHGCIVSTVQLPGVPIDIAHARLGEDDFFGVRCDDAHQTVRHYALRALTKAEFTHVHRVVVGDFVGNGHHQMLLVGDDLFQEARWVLTDIDSVYPASARKLKQTKKGKKASRRQVNDDDDGRIHVHMDKLKVEPDQAKKLKTIQASLALRAQIAAADVAREQAMLEHKKSLGQMMQHNVWDAWIQLRREKHPESPMPIMPTAPTTASFPELQTVVPPLDDNDDEEDPPSKDETPPTGNLGHPMELVATTPMWIQHTPSKSILFLRATVRNVSTQPLHDATLVVAPYKCNIVGRVDIREHFAPNEVHDFAIEIDMSQDMYTQSAMRVNLLGHWGESDCLFFPNGHVNLKIEDILRLPVETPDQDSVEFVLLSKTCQLDQWLPAHQAELGVQILHLQPGAADVVVSAPNAAVLDGKVAHLRRLLKPHDIFCIEDPRRAAHMELIGDALAKLKAEVTATTNVEVLAAQIDADLAVGHLLQSMERRSHFQSL